MFSTQGLLSFIRSISLEFRRAFQLSKRMLHAGQTNVELKDTLSELGLRTYQAMKTRQVTWDDNQMQMLISKVDYLEKMMHDHEIEIKKVKVL